MSYDWLRNCYSQSNNQASQRGASDSFTDSSMLSNPAEAHNVSCLGLCGRVFSQKAILDMSSELLTHSC